MEVDDAVAGHALDGERELIELVLGGEDLRDVEDHVSDLALLEVVSAVIGGHGDGAVSGVLSSDLHVLEGTFLQNQLQNDELGLVAAQRLNTCTSAEGLIQNVEGATGHGIAVVIGLILVSLQTSTGPRIGGGLVGVQVVNQTNGTVEAGQGDHVGALVEDELVVDVAGQRLEANVVLVQIRVVLLGGSEGLAIAVVVLISISVGLDLLGGQGLVVDTETVDLAVPLTSFAGVTEVNVVKLHVVLGLAFAYLRTVGVHEDVSGVGVIGVLFITLVVVGVDVTGEGSEIGGDSQGLTIEVVPCIVDEGTVTVVVLILVLVLQLELLVVALGGSVLLTATDEDGQLVVRGAEQGDVIGSSVRELAGDDLDGVIVTLESVLNGVGQLQVATAVLDDQSTLVPGDLVVGNGCGDVDVVSVTGQVLPQVSLNVVGTVGVVGRVVPSNQAVLDVLCLLVSSGGADDEATENHRNDHGKCDDLLHSVHLSFSPFKIFFGSARSALPCCPPRQRRTAN